MGMLLAYHREQPQPQEPEIKIEAKASIEEVVDEVVVAKEVEQVELKFGGPVLEEVKKKPGRPARKEE